MFFQWPSRQTLQRLYRDRRGNILIPAALALPILIGVAALVAEYGGGLIEKSENQRVADLASYAGALSYASTKSTTRMSEAAKNVAALNGVLDADVTATLETSPKNSGSKAVYVKIRTQRELFLSKIINPSTELNIYAEAMAEVGGKATPGCVLALSPSQTGVTLSGGTKIEAEKCSVSSNNTVTVPCGTSITAVGVNYNSASPPTQPCPNSIKGPNNTAAIIAKHETPDPLAGNAAIASAVARFDHFSSLAAMVAPTAPSAASGLNIEFAYDNTRTISQATALGCSASKTGSNWNLNCGTNSVVNIGTVTIGGGINVDFNLGGPSTTTYNFSSLVTTSATTRFGPGTYNFANGLTTNGTTTFGSGTFSFGKAVTTNGTTGFGSGTFNFTKGLTIGGGATTTFGAGTFKIGQSDASCNGARYSICNTGTTLTFGGPSTFELYAGFSNGGGSTLTFGSGSTNSFKLGPSSNGNAIDLGGGSRTFMADATAANSVFQVKGHVNGGGGGSCFIIATAANHDIDGNFIASGAVLLGAGVYTVNGYFSLGQSSGGSATCSGQTFSVKAVDVSLVISGKNVSNSGSCNGYVFCIAADYNGVQLTAPTTGAMAKLAVVGPQSTAITAGAIFAEGGANAQISGAFYFPKGPIIMSGGASTFGSKTDPNMCLQLVGSRITLLGGTAAASECIAASGASGSDKVSLIR